LVRARSRALYFRKREPYSRVVARSRADAQRGAYDQTQALRRALRHVASRAGARRPRRHRGPGHAQGGLEPVPPRPRSVRVRHRPGSARLQRA
jgi:hypothetical protein